MIDHVNMSCDLSTLVPVMCREVVGCRLRLDWERVDNGQGQRYVHTNIVHVYLAHLVGYALGAMLSVLHV